MSDRITYTTDATFKQDVLEADGLVLLDFWAEWCGPCKMIAPSLDALAEEYDGRLRIAKLNIDENPQTPRTYNVRSIPTLLLVRDGNIVGQQIGAVSKSQLAAFVDSQLG